MLRLGLRTISTTAAVFFLTAAQVSADTGPQPPPLAGGVQPVSASTGSSTQPNNSASLSSGRAWGSADGQQAEGNSCGAQAGAAGNGYAVQPTKAGTTGTTAPVCASSGAGTSAQGSGAAAGGQGNGASIGTQGTGSGAGSTAGGSAAANGSGANAAGQTRGGLKSLGILGIGNGSNGAGGGPWWPWLLLALFVGLLFFLLGIVVAPKRRREPNPA